MASEVGKLEEQALKRKERLKALKQHQQEATTDTQRETSTEEQPVLPKPVFRSYQPQDESLKEHQLEKVKPVEVIDKVRDQLDAAKPEPLVEEVDLMNLAPCKPDWDLKRDIAKKLEKLERRTQRAIAEIIRERLFAEKDLAGAVASWVNSDGQTGSKSSSVIGPKLPSNYDKPQMSTVGSNTVSATFDDARTADIGFDDDSD